MEAYRGAMKKQLLKELGLLFIFLVLSTMLIAYTGSDLRASAKFYINAGWPVGQLFPWKFLYRLDRIPALILSTSAIASAAWGLADMRRRHLVRPGLYLVLVLALGPGLLVNVILKDHWGRPRPRDIVQFGGKMEFQQPWQPGIPGKGRSFPSGHSSAAFYIATPYLVYRRSRAVYAGFWLAGGILFGIAMSYARIAQGGHFLSDTLWSFGLVWITALLLSPLLPDGQAKFHQETSG